MPRKHWLVALVIGWVALLAVGLAWTFQFETSEGSAAATPEQWPARSTIPHAPDRPTVVMFVHAGCVCSRASLRELAAAVDATHGTALVVVLIAGPDDQASALVDQIPGVVRIQGGAFEAQRFGALTSGYTVVYGPGGQLRFAGGITGSRGHVGDNVGRRALIGAIENAPAFARHPVFGCALVEGT